jgi:formylglycine-generating enzyme required for sulfatase activity
MLEQRAVDITHLAVLGEMFPLRLMQLGFHLMQVIDEEGRDWYQYILPPLCDVPAGPFTLGDGRQKDNIPCRVTLDNFQISKYPLTVAEYACAVQIGVIEEPKTNIVPRGSNFTWHDQMQRVDHPVVNITWFQAREYATWLAQVTGDAWHLPTEAEWEKAARGTDRRIYPWGNKPDRSLANTSRRGIRTTTPVGKYPQGASPYSVQDMAGNVWEWCSSLYQHYPYYPDDGREDARETTKNRVMRGGSWRDGFSHASAAFRNQAVPHIATTDIGVRLAVSQPE